MKKIIAVAIAAVSLAGASSAFAQNTANATANGSVTLIRPITITKTADLEFGRIVKPSNGTGTAVIANTSDAVTAGSGAVALGGITTSRAKFTITGEAAQAYTLAVPASFVISNGPGNDITVTTSPDITPGTVTPSGTLGSGFSTTLNVGGSINVPDTAATGLYTGTFTVTVTYN